MRVERCEQKKDDKISSWCSLFIANMQHNHVPLINFDILINSETRHKLHSGHKNAINYGKVKNDSQYSCKEFERITTRLGKKWERER